MKLVFSGTEVPSNRKLLEDCGVSAFGWSWSLAKKRGFPTTKPFSFDDNFNPSDLIFVVPGINEKGLTEAAAESEAADYQDFVMTHQDRISGFTEFDSHVLGADWVKQQRAFYAEEAESEFWPIWDISDGIPALHAMAAMYPNIALRYSTLAAPANANSQIKAIHQQHGTAFHALSCSKTEVLQQVPLVTASTLAWNAPQRLKETIVWDGTSLSRYPKKLLANALPRLKPAADRYGLDFEKLKSGDSKEATRLAIYSFKSLEDNLNKRPTGRSLSLIFSKSEDDHSEGSAVLTPEHVDNRPEEPGTDIALARPSAGPRAPEDRRPLPVFGQSFENVLTRGKDGLTSEEAVPVVTSLGRSLRQCDTCFLADKCPEFKPQEACAYDFPVEIRTREQVRAALSSVIETQMGRVAFAKMAEDINGGYPDPNVSIEMDRLFAQVAKLKDISDDGSSFKMTVEARNDGGVISRIFGAGALQRNQQPLPAIEAGAIIREIVDV